MHAQALLSLVPPHSYICCFAIYSVRCTDARIDVVMKNSRFDYMYSKLFYILIAYTSLLLFCSFFFLAGGRGRVAGSLDKVTIEMSDLEYFLTNPFAICA